MKASQSQAYAHRQRKKQTELGFRQFKDGEGKSGISCPLLQADVLTQAIPSPNCWVLGPLVFSPGETNPKGVRLAKCGLLLTVETCEIF